MEFKASPVTALLEACATAVGVGMVLGGFAAGLVSVLLGRSQELLERRVLQVGYLTAAFCLAMRLLDIATTI